MFERLRAVNPDALPARIVVPGHHEAAGEHAQVRLLVEEIRAVNSDLTVEQIGGLLAGMGFGPEHVSTIQENLRRAGLFDHVEAAPLVDGRIRDGEAAK